MRLLTRSDVERAITMRAAVEIIRRAFSELSTGQAVVPLRTAIEQRAHDGVTLFMPGYLRGSESLAVKIASVHHRNRERGLPLIHALVIVIDPATGQPVAAMEGGYLTALRTGAASGVATELLARRDAEVAAVIGAGGQSRTQIQALAVVRRLRRVLIFDREPEKVQALMAEFQPQLSSEIELCAAASAAEAVRQAHIICTATTSRTPVFDGADLQPGTHINAIGSYTPEMQEVDCLTLQRAAKIVIDSRAGALAEAGDLLIALERGAIQLSDIYGEIGEIAAGLKPGRESDDEITYFKSVGNAAQDAAIAHAIYQQALQHNLGTEFDLLA
ncbi:MAG TPA: ornithine cyclodeaminase family protein [Blastocatellia bacterium]|nr:ornithine cyclodeaminase family protein [Blastocatellia bacterium]